MKKRSYTIDWNSNENIIVFDKTKRSPNNVLAWYSFDKEDELYYVGEEWFEEEHPDLNDWKKAVQKRIGCMIDWRMLEKTGGSVSIKLNYSE